MRISRSHFGLIAVMLLGACADDEPSEAGLIASEVACPATVAATVTAPGFAFTPAAVTIAQGEVIKFTMPASHDAVSSDELWDADFSADTCVRFDAIGTYDYFCSPHGFTGTVVVE